MPVAESVNLPRGTGHRAAAPGRVPVPSATPPSLSITIVELAAGSPTCRQPATERLGRSAPVLRS